MKKLMLVVLVVLSSIFVLSSGNAAKKTKSASNDIPIYNSAQGQIFSFDGSDIADVFDIVAITDPTCYTSFCLWATARYNHSPDDPPDSLQSQLVYSADFGANWTHEDPGTDSTWTWPPVRPSIFHLGRLFSAFNNFDFLMPSNNGLVAYASPTISTGGPALLSEAQNNFIAAFHGSVLAACPDGVHTNCAYVYGVEKASPNKIHVILTYLDIVSGRTTGIHRLQENSYELSPATTINDVAGTSNTTTSGLAGVFLATNNGLYYCADYPGCTTWNQNSNVAAPLSHVAAKIVGTSSQKTRIYASGKTNGRLYIADSSDNTGGNDWQSYIYNSSTTQQLGQHITGIALDNSNDDRVYISSYGTSASLASTGNALNPENIANTICKASKNERRNISNEITLGGIAICTVTAGSPPTISFPCAKPYGTRFPFYSKVVLGLHTYQYYDGSTFANPKILATSMNTEHCGEGGFTIFSEAPEVYAVSPASGSAVSYGDTMTITGNNLAGAIINFGGKSITDFIAGSNDHTISFIIPEGDASTGFPPCSGTFQVSLKYMFSDPSIEVGTYHYDETPPLITCLDDGSSIPLGTSTISNCSVAIAGSSNAYAWSVQLGFKRTVPPDGPNVGTISIPPGQSTPTLIFSYGNITVPPASYSTSYVTTISINIAQLGGCTYSNSFNFHVFVTPKPPP